MTEQRMSMREALNLALDHALETDPRVFLLGEDIADPGATGPTAGLSSKYGHDRVLDTPISEAAIVGAAVGAAIEGMLPVAEIMIMDFIGIAADQLGRLFQPFDQLDGSITRQHGGTGLGLAICRKIMDGHDGRISARSTPGRGSVFTAVMRLAPGARPA